MNIGQQQKGGLTLGGGGGGLQLGGLGQQQGQLSGGLGIGASQQTSGVGLGLGGGLKLGMPTAAVAPQQSSSVSLPAPSLGHTGGLQLGNVGGGGGLKLGQTTQTTQAKGGLQLGLGGGGLQLGGGVQNKGVQLGGLQTATTAPPVGLGAGKGLQLGGGGGGGLAGTSHGVLGGGGVGLGLKTGLPGPTAPVSATDQTSTTSFRGLGGVDPTLGKIAGGGRGSSTSVMEQQLPSALNQLVGEFSQHMRRQTTIGDEMNKCSDSDMKKVQQETVTQKEVVGEVLTVVQRDVQRVNFLKKENTETLDHVEIAQRTYELPVALQHENTAPAQYFYSVVTVYEEKMEMYRNQLLELESHLSAVCQDHTMSPQNLVDILQVQYKPFLLLAAQLQSIHEQLQVLKEQYLAYRRLFLQDSTDVFEEKRRKKESGGERGRVKTGPPPFSTAMGQATTALAAFSTSSVPGGGGGGGILRGGGVGVGGIRTGVGGLTAGGGGLGGLGGLNVGGFAGGGGVGLVQQNKTLTLGGLGASQPSLASGAGTTGTIVQGFQLQKPPPGKKRGGTTT